MPRLSPRSALRANRVHQSHAAERWMASSDGMAARLRKLAAELRQSGARKQETSGSGVPKVSTAHHLLHQEARAASAQFDTVR